MMITRWVRAPIQDGVPQGLVFAAMGLRIDLGDGTGIYEVEFSSVEQLNDAQAAAANIPNLRVLPGLNTPIAKLAPAVLAWLNSKLQINQLAAGDTVLDALRKLRSEFGGKFNVDSPY
jgi:hypothetical protein